MLETVDKVEGRKNIYRCYICGHVFYYEIRPRLEKKYGEGTHIYEYDALNRKERKMKTGVKGRDRLIPLSDWAADKRHAPGEGYRADGILMDELQTARKIFV
jgi:hypothetical protein